MTPVPTPTTPLSPTRHPEQVQPELSDVSFSGQSRKAVSAGLLLALLMSAGAAPRSDAATNDIPNTVATQVNKDPVGQLYDQFRTLNVGHDRALKLTEAARISGRTFKEVSDIYAAWKDKVEIDRAIELTVASALLKTVDMKELLATWKKCADGVQRDDAVKLSALAALSGKSASDVVAVYTFLRDAAGKERAMNLTTIAILAGKQATEIASSYASYRSDQSAGDRAIELTWLKYVDPTQPSPLTNLRALSPNPNLSALLAYDLLKKSLFNEAQRDRLPNQEQPDKK